MVTNVVVIGGGVGGLAAAALAAQAGHRVTLLERHDELGGRARVWRTGGYVFDTGPSWWLMPEVFTALFDRLGIPEEKRPQLQRLDPGYRIYHPDLVGPIDITTHPDRLHAIWESLDPSTTDALDDYLASATRTYRLAIENYLYTDYSAIRTLASGVAARDLATLGGLLTTSLHRYVARRFRHPLQRAILEYPAIFLGTDPHEAPALYHLMSHLDLVDGVQYPQGGFGQLVDTLVNACTEAGVHIVTGAQVTRIHTDSARAEHSTIRRRHARQATGVAWTNHCDKTRHTIDADVVISAASISQLGGLLPETAQTTAGRRLRSAKPGMAAVVASLGTDRPFPNLAHHTFLFAADWEKNMDRVFGRASDDDPTLPTSLYISRPSATDPSLAPAGKEALFLLVPVGRRDGTGGEDGGGDAWVEQRVDAALAQIEEVTQSPGLRSSIVVRRTLGPTDFDDDYSSPGGALLGPAHTLTQSGPFRGAVRAPGVDGVYLVGGSTRPGVGLPMVIISADVAVDAVSADIAAGGKG